MKHNYLFFPISRPQFFSLIISGCLCQFILGKPVFCLPSDIHVKIILEQMTKYSPFLPYTYNTQLLRGAVQF